MMRRILTTTALGLFGTVAVQPAARADFGGEAGWWKSFAISGYVDAGFMGNLSGSTDNTNWGRLFDDRANHLELNQASALITRPLDPNADDFDFGFTIQPMFGTDARFTHVLGTGLDHVTSRVNQLTFIEADVQMHLPWTVGGGSEVKIGLFPSPMSAETTVPTTNPFYSHSYIFNFGVTVAHVGVYTSTHPDPLYDVFLGVDAGNQTTPWQDNNSSAAGFVGADLNLLGGNLTITWLNHLGPENPTGTVNQNGQVVDGKMRWESDLTAVWKYNDNLTFTTDANFIRDAGFDSDAYGVAQYASFAANNTITLNARAEVWRDDKGFFVAANPGNLDPLKGLIGEPSTAISVFPRGVTYSEVTLGVTYKQHLPDPLGDLLVRPEIRYDNTLNDAHPFKNGSRYEQFTVGADAIVSF